MKKIIMQAASLAALSHGRQFSQLRDCTRHDQPDQPQRKSEPSESLAPDVKHR